LPVRCTIVRRSPGSVGPDRPGTVLAAWAHLGGGSFRYDPLPAKLLSRRRRLRLIYHDGRGLWPLSLGQAKALAPVS
jgi:hypothetical protein